MNLDGVNKANQTHMPQRNPTMKINHRYRKSIRNNHKSVLPLDELMHISMHLDQFALMHQDNTSHLGNLLPFRRYTFVKQKRRYPKIYRQQIPNDGEIRSSAGFPSSWAATTSTSQPQYPEDVLSLQEPLDVPLEELLVRSLTSIVLSTRSEHLAQLERSKLTMEIHEGDQFRKPVEHHKDLMPLNDLAMLMSAQLTAAKGKGLFGPIEPKRCSW